MVILNIISFIIVSIREYFKFVLYFFFFIIFIFRFERIVWIIMKVIKIVVIEFMGNMILSFGLFIDDII